MKLINQVILTDQPITGKRTNKRKTFKKGIRIFCDYGYLFINHTGKREIALYFSTLDNYHLNIDCDTRIIEFTRADYYVIMKFINNDDFFYCRGCLIDFETDTFYRKKKIEIGN